MASSSFPPLGMLAPLIENRRLHTHYITRNAPIQQHPIEVTIQKLPTELQLSILSFLSVKNIVRFRRTCRQFAQLVEAPENHVTFLKPRIDRKVVGLDDAIQRLCYFDATPTPSAFIKAIQAYYAHRGIHRSSLRLSEARVFAELWLRRQERGRRSRRVHDLSTLVLYILYLHIEQHATPLRDPEPWEGLTRRVVLHRPRFPVPEAGVFTKFHWDEIRLKISSGQGLWSVESEESNPSSHTGYPEDERLSNRLSWHYGWQLSQLAELVCVPALPCVARTCFLYKVRSQAVFDLVTKAIRYGTSLGPPQRAALIDELYIY